MISFRNRSRGILLLALTAGPAALLLALLVTLAALSGCGGKEEQAPTPLTFEELSDTAALSKGKPLLDKIEPYREANGVLRVRGQVLFPDGVRIQISLYTKDTQQLLKRVQVIVEDHHFVSPPMLGAEGPLPGGEYRFEYMALFNAAWQTPGVMRRTDAGRNLRGPGVTRDRVGGAAFYLIEERRI